MNAERLAATLIDLCRIPSPSGREAAVAALIRRRVEALGLAVEEDDAAAALDGECNNLIVHGLRAPASRSFCPPTWTRWPCRRATCPW